MADTNPNASEMQKKREDELDRMLDAGLAAYSAVEPRAGLEGRILVNLRAEQARPVGRAWWQWGLAGAVAAMAIIAVVAWRSTRIPHPAIADHRPVTIKQPSTKETNPVPGAASERAAAKHPAARQPAARRTPVATAVAASPKLDQFPSRQPLSAEEVALTQYVKNFPKEAQLVAQAQEEFELETQKEMNDAGVETRLSDSTQKDSIQPER